MTSAGMRAARAITIVLAAAQLGSCSGGDDEATDTTSWASSPVAELSARLADPVASTDCELDPSGYITLSCGAAATAAAEALGDKGDPAGIPALAASVRGPETYTGVADASWEALERIGGPEVTAVLVESITAAIDPVDDAQRGQTLVVAERAAEILGRLGGVEHNRLLAEAGRTPFGCQSTGYFEALVMINKADATPLVALLEATPATDWVYGPLIAIGQPDTQDALIAALAEGGDPDMAECFLNSENPDLERAAEEWAAAHGYTISKLPGGGAETWGSG